MQLEKWGRGSRQTAPQGTLCACLWVRCAQVSELMQVLARVPSLSPPPAVLQGHLSLTHKDQFPPGAACGSGKIHELQRVLLVEGSLQMRCPFTALCLRP